MAETVGLVFNERKFMCPRCGKEYQSEASLKKHIKEKHPDENSSQE